MWRIAELLNRFGNLILFLLLELLSLVIIISANSPQQMAFLNFTHSVSGSFTEFRHEVAGYFGLNDKNLGLQDENSRLHREITELRMALSESRDRFPYKLNYYHTRDSLMPANGFRFIPSRAINNSLNQNYNYITLNKGEVHGVSKGMGVISPDGVAGMVIATSPHFSLSMSVLNKNFRLSARVKTNQNTGSVSWDGRDPQYGVLEFIPQTSPLHVGDTVVTSGYSQVFPPDYVLGVIHKFDENNHDGFYNITVKLSTDFRKLDQVYLVANEYRTELDTLENRGVH